MLTNTYLIAIIFVQIDKIFREILDKFGFNNITANYRYAIIIYIEKD